VTRALPMLITEQQAVQPATEENPALWGATHPRFSGLVSEVLSP